MGHKTNCLRARRALDPIKYAEGLVKVPGVALDFTDLIHKRVKLIVGQPNDPNGVAETHQWCDEAATPGAHALQFVAGQQILAGNADDAETIIGPVWNPRSRQS